jgi:hypothetical protein
MQAFRWLVLLHQIPPEPLYFRAKILRKIKHLGAVAVKKAAYVLPNRPECLEDLQWLRKEISAGGGEAWILEGDFRAGLDAREIEDIFCRERSADYEALAVEAGELRGSEAIKPRIGRLRKRLQEIAAIDFFSAPGRVELERMIDQLERSEGVQKMGEVTAKMRNHIWVTRANVGVDRMASAWLIRRRIDPEAQFRFVEDPADCRSGEIRFDMFEGEFTHDGDSCTFEVLLERHGLEGAGLRAIAEIIHDLDLKESKFGRAETAGVGAALEGIQKRWNADAERLEQAAAYFDILEAQFNG